MNTDADYGRYLVPVSGNGRGRPRSNPPRRAGADTQEEILDAAAELFTRDGFAATSMDAIAKAVGVRQNAIYHHFGSKLNLLRMLLHEGVRPGLEMVDALAEAPSATDVDVIAKLYTLTVGDVAVLATWRWNLGALYLLPEARTAELDPFQRERHRLREAYVQLAGYVTDITQASDTGDLTYRLVVSVVNQRSDGLVTAETPLRLGHAVLQLCGVPRVEAEVLNRSKELVQEFLPAHTHLFPADWVEPARPPKRPTR